MVNRRSFLGGLAATTLLPSLGRAADRDIEPEFLRDQLRAGNIPALADRIPVHPRIVNMKELGLQPGTYGGTVRSIIGSAKDIR